MKTQRLFHRISPCLCTLIVALCLASKVHAQAGNPTITRAGDALQLLLPLAAFGATVYEHDSLGAVQYAKGLALTLGAAELSKNTLHEWRPDHSNTKSFPSGHAASAFSAPAFVRQRYGWEYAAPLYALAAYTGYSRVQARRHYWHDVAGSALLAELSNAHFASPYKNAALAVGLRPQGQGLALNLSYQQAW